MANLRLNEMSDADFCHDWNGDSIHDFLDHFRIRHTGNAALLANIRRNPLKSHDSTGACLFSNPRLFGAIISSMLEISLLDDIHDNTSVPLADY
jgi:hypothetical protein